jgi:UDP-4-amino-4,6-dideoxy-N-acetyl-beta-L-altrosamine transaminase
MIPYGRQQISDDDVASVVEVLRSDFLTQGPAVPRFEAAVMRATGAKHAIASNSATSALHIACMALGLGEGGRLWTTPNTFVASANCGRYCGAEVDFVDIDAATWCLSPAKLADKLVQARKSGTLPDVVVPVAFGGEPADMTAIGALAREFGFKTVEDASHAIGARHAKGAVGDGTQADVTVFSFHPVKIVTTAEGGMGTTKDDAVAAKMARLRTHGITRDPAEMTRASPGPWYYEQIELGYNYRLTDLQAALGVSQMTRLEEFVARRNRLAARYKELLKDSPLRWQRVGGDTRSSYHLFVVRLDDAARRDAAFVRMRAAGVGVNVHYIPVHLQPYWRARGFAPGYCPEAERYGTDALTLPLHAGMTDMEQDRVVDALRAALR